MSSLLLSIGFAIVDHHGRFWWICLSFSRRSRKMNRHGKVQLCSDFIDITTNDFIDQFVVAMQLQIGHFRVHGHFFLRWQGKIDIIVMDDHSRLDIGLNLFNSRSSDHNSPLRHSISTYWIFFPKLLFDRQSLCRVNRGFDYSGRSQWWCWCWLMASSLSFPFANINSRSVDVSVISRSIDRSFVSNYRLNEQVKILFFVMTIRLILFVSKQVLPEDHQSLFSRVIGNLRDDLSLPSIEHSCSRRTQSSSNWSSLTDRSMDRSFSVD